ncbi:MAG: bifunctional methylenetetrahydrofolate dehydrogenase/methenyltetrahydrofolate cyclohydrolase FolD [Bacteroidetes bacterium]|nr:MAG: bifunctional methylenetetrahydrofolate dehydrogenase/methenyltetrahydrofolate cyclohydrolase FolD [Bacteroidota bacterium]
MKIIDGKEVSNFIKDQIAREVAQLTEDGMRPPHLAALLVGNDGASRTYVNAKVKACEKVGFQSSVYHFEEDIPQETLLQKIEELNLHPDIDGFIVQLPLPPHIDENIVTEAISPAKDVDGFHPENIGKMVLGLPSYLPATPYGIIKLLEYYQIPTEGKHCVVIGRSNIVGTPISLMLSRNTYPGNASVTLTHSKTQNLKSLTLQADILIAAVGKPRFVTADMVKENAVVIDVGIHRIPSGQNQSGFKLIGDVDFENVKTKASYITPVPGGVGPMTIAALLLNTLQAYKTGVYAAKV